jgi:hypothetical protein
LTVTAARLHKTEHPNEKISNYGTTGTGNVESSEANVARGKSGVSETTGRAIKEEAMSDLTAAPMKRYGVPLTTENWLYLEYCGRPPLSLEEIYIPAEILRAERQAAKAFDAQFLRSIGVRGTR